MTNCQGKCLGSFLLWFLKKKLLLPDGALNIPIIPDRIVFVKGNKTSKPVSLLKRKKELSNE